MLKTHHLNCISECPLGGRLMDGHTRSLVERGLLACHCILVETDDTLILVDTGFGLNDVANPKARLSHFFLTLNKPAFNESLTAIKQIETLGFNPKDVRHIVLTHLDFDHAGGLDDFPWAKVHLLSTEKAHALKQKTWLDRQRFRPEQWSTIANWATYHPGEGEAWHGFSRVHGLDGINADIAMIPLIGHTLGHAGVAIRRGEKWLLQAGDAYMMHGEMNVHRPHCTPGLRLYQWMMEKDRKARLWNQERLRDLIKTQGPLIDVICSHDMTEFQRWAHQATPFSSASRATFEVQPGH